jgi:hypothetical protein
MSETTKTPVTAFSRRVQHQAGRAVLWLRPDGWQARSRQNAWLAIAADRQRRQERVAADSAVPQQAGAPKVRAGA